MSTNVLPQSRLLAAAERDLHSETAALCQLVNLGRGRFTLALIEYDLPRACGRVIRDLREQFSALNIVEAELAPPPPDAPLSYNLLDQLKTVVGATSPDKPPDVLILKGLEILLPPSISRDADHITDDLLRALQPLNLGRNILAEMFPCPLLLFLPKAAMEVLLTSAPDIVSWKSGFFVFESDLNSVRDELQREAYIEVGWIARRRLRRLTSAELLRETKRIAALIADARALPSHPIVIAHLYSRLGLTALADENWFIARQCFAEMLRLARGQNDAKLIKVAEKGLRRVEKLQLQWRLFAQRRRVLSNPSANKLQSFRGAAAISKADGLFGREIELQELMLQVNRIGNRFVTVWGETGCGKTSLVLAGVVPMLEQQRHLSVVFRDWVDPTPALLKALERDCGLSLSSSDSLRKWLQAAAQKNNKTIVIVCDQFEQFFIKHPNRQEREPLLKEIGACLNDFRLPCQFIFILREDYLGRMVELEKFVVDALDKNKRFYLSLFDQVTALRVMRQLSNRAKLAWPDVFLNEVIKDLTIDGQVRPIELQLVGAALTTLNINDEQAYSRAGRAEGLLTDYLQATLESVSNTRRELKIMKRVLLALIEEPDERLSLKAEEIAFRTEVHVSNVRKELNKLITTHLVSCTGEASKDKPTDNLTVLYELMHDVLVDSVLRLTRNFQDKRRQAQKIVTRALEDVRTKPRYTISSREWWVLRWHLPAKAKDDPKVKALLRRSLIFGIVRWFTLGFLTPLAILIFIQTTFTHVTIEQDYSDRIVIRRGLPQLGFLPLIGNDVLIDTGFTVRDLKPERRSIVQGIRVWELESGRAGAIHQTRFYESFGSEIEQSKLLIKMGRKHEGLTKLLLILKDDEDRNVRDVAVKTLVAAVKTDHSLAKPTFDALLPILNVKTEIGSERGYRANAIVPAVAAAIEADPSLIKQSFNSLISALKANKDYTLWGHPASEVLAKAIKIDRSLAKPAFDLALPNLKQSISIDHTSAATLAAAAIEVDPSLGPAAFNDLLFTSGWYSPGEQTAKALSASIKANPALAKHAFDLSLLYFTDAKMTKMLDLYQMDDKVTAILTTAIEVDHSQAEPVFNPSLVALKDDKSNNVRYTAARAIVAAIKAKPSLAKQAFIPLLSILRQNKEHTNYSEYWEAAPLVTVISIEPSLAKPAVDTLLPVLLERDGDSDICNAVAEVIAAAMKTDHALIKPTIERLVPFLTEKSKTRDERKVTDAEASVLVAVTNIDPSLAKPSFDLLFSVLGKANNSIWVRIATAEALGAATRVDPSLAKPVLNGLLFVLKGDYQVNDVRSAAAQALKNCIATNEEVRRTAASQLFTDYNANILQGVIDGFAIYLAILAEEEAKSGRSPVQFLLDHLEGKRSLMPNGNANTYAGYRQVAEGAMALWMVSKRPEAVATQASLRQRLETMRDHDLRMHLRIAAWDTLSAAAALRDSEDFQDFNE